MASFKWRWGRLGLLVVLVLSMTFLVLWPLQVVLNGPGEVNGLRLAVHPLARYLEKNWESVVAGGLDVAGLLRDQGLEGRVVFADGLVLGSTLESGDMGNIGNISSRGDLEMWSGFSAPLTHEGRVVAYILVEQVDLKARSMGDVLYGMPLLWWLSLGLLGLGWLYFMGLMHREWLKEDLGVLMALEKALKDAQVGTMGPLQVRGGSGSPQKSDLYGGLVLQYNALVYKLDHLYAKNADDMKRRGAFLTVLAHELKTPIATIQAYIQGIASGVAADEPTRQRYIQIIEERMAGLVHQVESLFEYAQLADAKLKYEMVEVYGDACLAPAFRALEGLGVRVENRLPRVLIRADSLRLEQVVMNLYNNGLKYGGAVMGVAAYRDGDWLVVSVTDEGAGIDPEDLPYVFDPYYQGRRGAGAGRGSSASRGGAGMGLTICKAIVLAHGGTMDVRSERGRGTAVTFRIPVL